MNVLSSLCVSGSLLYELGRLCCPVGLAGFQLARGCQSTGVTIQARTDLVCNSSLVSLTPPRRRSTRAVPPPTTAQQYTTPGAPRTQRAIVHTPTNTFPMSGRLLVSESFIFVWPFLLLEVPGRYMVSRSRVGIIFSGALAPHRCEGYLPVHHRRGISELPWRWQSVPLRAGATR